LKRITKALQYCRKRLVIDYLVSYENKAIGTQHKRITLNPKEFCERNSKGQDIRLTEQVKKQLKLGLIKGASLKNAVFFAGDRVKNPKA